MVASRRRTASQTKNGVKEVTLRTWEAFHDLVSEYSLYDTTVVWRGQHDPTWQLRPTLDRLLEKQASTNVLESQHPVVKRLEALHHEGVSNAYAEHLEAFKYATRGRRHNHCNYPVSENDWWALGQHFGLATPLLDWTTSPFVAAFFAFSGSSDTVDKHRCIWALSTIGTQEKSKTIRSRHKGENRPPLVEFIRPMSDDNPRLVSQGGLFTRGPDGVALDDWVRWQFKDETQRTILTKYTISGSVRDTCLRVLNRMNINHLSLFPDLIGASAYCNLGLTIRAYLPKIHSPAP